MKLRLTQVCLDCESLYEIPSGQTEDEVSCPDCASTAHYPLVRWFGTINQTKRRVDRKEEHKSTKPSLFAFVEKLESQINKTFFERSN